MSKMIQIRHVPDDLHRKLKARAVAEGKSLSDYLLGEVRHVADQPSMREFVERLRQRPRVTLPTQPADVIREFRGPLPR